MLSCVIASRHKFQILYPIIGSVVVSVMHVFIRLQFPTELRFHYETMFVLLFAVDHPHDVPGSTYAESSAFAPPS